MDVVLYNEIYLYAFILLHYKGYTMVELYIFQKLNMSELLKIFIDFDLLEDGVILTMEYIDIHTVVTMSTGPPDQDK
jgi:hypothetical protein